MSFCQDCFKAVRHEGVAQGKLETIGGIQSYVAEPTVDYPKDKVILFLHDAFGLSLINNQLLVDDFAANGFRTIMPDLIDGDVVPADAFSPTRATPFDIGAWAAKHSEASIRPKLDAVVAALKEQGVTAFGTTGYCLGGKYCIVLATDNISKVTVLNHPSLLSIPGDFEKFKAHSKNPILINSCEIDQMFPHEAQKLTDELLGDGKYAPGYVREYFPGCTHGFAVRGDMSDPRVKAGKEGAFKAAVEFLGKHL